MNRYVSIGEAAALLGVCVATLRRWDEDNKLIAERTKGNHRRYKLEDILEIYNDTLEQNINKTACYARVSTRKQEDNLKRQEQVLEQYCINQQYNYEIISDLGSGLNYKKKGLNKLLNLICNKQINRLVLTHKDRLLRFGSDMLFRFCKHFDVEVVIINDTSVATDYNQELVENVIELMTVFCAKLYGKRSHKNKNKLKNI